MLVDFFLSLTDFIIILHPYKLNKLLTSSFYEAIHTNVKNIFQAFFLLINISTFKKRSLKLYESLSLFYEVHDNFYRWTERRLWFIVTCRKEYRAVR